MIDTALLQLLAKADPQVPTLLVLDENAAPLPRSSFASVQVLSNRSDICAQARAQGWPAEFNDFVFEGVAPTGYRQAIYRISKEKRVVEHVLQSLWALLPSGGVLLCCGYKNEGIKTFAKRAQEAWNCDATLQRGDLHLHVYRFEKRDNSATPLNSADYHALLPIAELNGQTLLSKPGIFAWDRFDAGSSFLLQYLRGFLQSNTNARVDTEDQSALDLGCGYGLLAMTLLQAGCRRVVATDNNAAAVRACTANLEQHRGSSDVAVVAANCGEGIEEHFDIVLCNPPFHQGFDVEQDLTDRFLLATRRLLHPKGRALFVVNSFIPLERKAAAHFEQATTLADNHHFKLTVLAKPLRPKR